MIQHLKIKFQCETNTLSNYQLQMINYQFRKTIYQLQITNYQLPFDRLMSCYSNQGKDLIAFYSANM